MITKEQALDWMVIWFNIGVVVLLLVALGGLLALAWAVRRRRIAWERYEQEREVNYPAELDIQPTEPWPRTGAGYEVPGDSLALLHPGQRYTSVEAEKLRALGYKLVEHRTLAMPEPTYIVVGHNPVAMPNPKR